MTESGKDGKTGKNIPQENEIDNGMITTGAVRREESRKRKAKQKKSI